MVRPKIKEPIDSLANKQTQSGNQAINLNLCDKFSDLLATLVFSTFMHAVACNNNVGQC